MREILRFAGNVIVAYQAQPLIKHSYSITVASLVSNPIVIAVAALVVAAIILVAFAGNGSHGCINMQSNDAGWVFANTDWNTQIAQY